MTRCSDPGRCSPVVARGPVLYVAHSVVVAYAGAPVAIRSIACLNTVQGRHHSIFPPAEPPCPL